MPLIKRPGRPTLHYRIDDFTDPWQNSPAVLLQHGYGRSSKFCASWVPHLARSYRVVRPDLRGTGVAGRFRSLAGSTLAGYVDDVLTVLDELGIASVHYCGESFGGIIGMALVRSTRNACARSLVASPVIRARRHRTPSRQASLTGASLAHAGCAEMGAGNIRRARLLTGGTDPALRD